MGWKNLMRWFRQAELSSWELQKSIPRISQSYIFSPILKSRLPLCAETVTLLKLPASQQYSRGPAALCEMLQALPISSANSH